MWFLWTIFILAMIAFLILALAATNDNGDDDLDEDWD
jgi:hypothetical protein